MKDQIKTLPQITAVIDNDPGPRISFNELMKKLLVNDARLRNYTFDANPKFRRLEIDGMIKNDYPGIEGSVVFQFRRLKESESKTNQVRKLFQQVVSSRASASCNCYILVTPVDLSVEDREWLNKFNKTHNLDLRHYGHTQIMDLLDQYQALKKYYYGRYLEGGPGDFDLLKQKYQEVMFQQVKNLEFVGLPTAQYQKRDLLKETELKNIYIPLKFAPCKGDSKPRDLSEIKGQFRRFVVLGEPGAGKSTLSKHLALECSKTKEDNDNNPSKSEDRIPLIIPLCDFVDIKKQISRTFGFIDYLKYIAENNYEFGCVDSDFFKAMLELGKAIVVFDGLDEIAQKSLRDEVVKGIGRFAEEYPDSSIWVTSRIFGYKNTGGLSEKIFKHYYITPVSVEQADQFIRNWYNIQVPDESDREEKIKALKKALEAFPYIQWLRSNPLFLTMLVILNQFESQLPDNRTTLYEKCLELLLRTWPNRKYSPRGQRNPMEERGISYEKQLELLSAVAVYTKNKYQDNTVEGESGSIPESELKKILFSERFDKSRIPEEAAREDANAFCGYIVERTGFLVEKGKRKGKEILFDFIHRSFRDYLYARCLAMDREKATDDHITFITKYVGKQGWQEIILFLLLLFKEHRSRDFIAHLNHRVFNELAAMKNPDAWLLMGRALRDNMEFDDKAIQQILAELLKQWLTNTEENPVFSVLEEIVGFSERGKGILKGLIKTYITNCPVKQVFASLFLVWRLYGIEDSFIHYMDKNKDKGVLLPYLPFFKANKSIARYIDENFKENQWVIYYNSTRERLLENLHNIIANQLSDCELKGYLLSSWAKIFNAFQQRKLFLDKNNQATASPLKMSGNIELDFSYVNFGFHQDYISHPLVLSRPFMVNPPHITLAKIDDNFFLYKEREIITLAGGEYITTWVEQVLEKIFSAFNGKLEENRFSSREEEHIKKQSREFAGKFGQNVSQYHTLHFEKDLNHYIYRHLAKSRRFLGMEYQSYLVGYFRSEFGQDLTRCDFNHEFRKKLGKMLGKAFGRYFRRDLSRDLSLILVQSFLEYLKDYPDNPGVREFRTLISLLYNKQYKKVLKWENLNPDHYKPIYALFCQQFSSDDLVFSQLFYICLYDYLFNYKTEVSFESIHSECRYLSLDNIIIVPKAHLPIRNPFMIPFAFNFILSGDLSHYIVKLLAHLNARFYKNSEPDETSIRKAVDNYCSHHPFVSYFINYSWDLFCREFEAQYRKNIETNFLPLAVFIINGAKLSLVTDMPCSGDRWDNILIEAEKSENPFVQISLSLYQLANYQDTEKESQHLEKWLGKFKEAYPGYFQLIGFNEGQVSDGAQSEKG
ncbi:MAG: NACHT domain-containing protein [Candidatus Aminicenantes bacterium]|nr:MAG: NACHT domain-containing protein [Candidatus Aminicenantes bacterium]